MKQEYPLELRFASAFDTVHYGLLGVHANAFLAGAFDDAATYPSWYDYPLLTTWHCQFRREVDRGLAADWAAEWFVYLRLEGARHLRCHFEEYAGAQQHYIYHDKSPKGLVLSAWKPRLFGSSCLSSWTPILEDPLSRQQRRHQNLPFSTPVGYPGDLGMDLLLQTRKTLDGTGAGLPDPAALQSKLDDLYQRGKAAGYVLPTVPDNSKERLAFFIDHFTKVAPTGNDRHYPCFPYDTQADDARHILIDAGMLRGQLNQVPERVPEHPYDDINRGLIYPSTDAGGKVFRIVWDGLRELGYEWLKLCYRPWQSSFSEPPEVRQHLRPAADLAYVGPYSASEGIQPGIQWLRLEGPR